MSNFCVNAALYILDGITGTVDPFRGGQRRIYVHTGDPGESGLDNYAGSIPSSAPVSRSDFDDPLIFVSGTSGARDRLVMENITEFTLTGGSGIAGQRITHISIGATATSPNVIPYLRAPLKTPIIASGNSIAIPARQINFGFSGIYRDALTTLLSEMLDPITTPGFLFPSTGISLLLSGSVDSNIVAGASVLTEFSPSWWRNDGTFVTLVRETDFFAQGNYTVIGLVAFGALRGEFASPRIITSAQRIRIPAGAVRIFIR